MKVWHGMRTLKSSLPLAAGAGLLSIGAVNAADAPPFAEDCAGCHAMTAPSHAGLETRTDRGGPPLYYAGNKFRRSWLVGWLQEPVRIRPAGDFPPEAVVAAESGDTVDQTKLADHPALTQEEAEAAAEWLMSLTPKQDLIDAEKGYEPGTVNPRLGAMDFVKFKGCGACHKDTPEYGGLSGPELYTAWQRLQPEFVVSYIRDPWAWEPYSLMPAKELTDASIHKLADYLRTIGEGEE